MKWDDVQTSITLSSRPFTAILGTETVSHVTPQELRLVHLNIRKKDYLLDGPDRRFAVSEGS